MAEVLILAGESAWIQSRALNADEICVQHASEKSPDTLVQIAFRSGRVPYDGGYGFANGIALAWVGDWRNRTQTLEIEGISSGTIAEELIALWKKRGIDMQENVHGLMACVLWDESTGQLHAFRDKIGLVPMVYTMDPSTRSIVISSDADWLLEASCLPRLVNRSRLTKYLLGISDRGRDDFVQGLSRIRPRECVNWSNQRLTAEYYWNPDTSYLRPCDDHVRQFRELLSEILDSLGAHPRVYEMSGGLDSPSLVAIAVENQRKNPVLPPVQTVSMIAPKYPQTDESLEIKYIADYLKVDSQCFSISEYWPLKDLNIYNGFFGMGPRPFSEEDYTFSFKRWLYRGFGDVNVVGGLGADQVLASNYKLYIKQLFELRQYESILSLSKRPFWRRIILVNILELLRLKKLAKLSVSAFSLNDKYMHVKCWLSPKLWVEESISPNKNDLHHVSASKRNIVNDKRLSAQQYWSWEYVCRSAYRLSAYSKLRTVYPFLDDRLWSFSLRISSLELIDKGRPKGFLRKVVRPLLPVQIIERRKQSFYDSIVEKSFNVIENRKIQGLMERSLLQEYGFIKVNEFLACFEEYQKEYFQMKHKHLGSIPIWTVLSAELWMRGFRN